MKVFLSYDYKDTKLARRVANTLRESGFQVWDETQILPGDNWGASLGEALAESDAMVVLLTPDSVRSPYVARGVSYALGERRYKGRLIPVIAAPSEEFAPGEIPWVFNLEQFQMLHVPNLEQDEEGLKEIAQALKAVA